LLKDEKSILHELVYSLEKSEIEKLVEMARLAYKNTETQLPLVRKDSSKKFDSKTNETDNDLVIKFSNNEKESFLNINA
jgi:hypothetical protein